MDLAEIVRRTEEVFTAVHRRAFLGDPAANPRLTVEVADAEMVAGVPALVLVTPWTLNGLVFPSGHRFPAALTVAGRESPLLANRLDELGEYLSVNLARDVSTIESPAAARSLARSLAPLFRAAVARALDDESVPDPTRRKLLQGRSD